MANLCDKCGTEVPEHNDATIIEAAACGNIIVLFCFPRHFLPIPGVCEGSPSRAQYIEGQPRSARYPYDPKLERYYREAYSEVLAKFAK